MTGDSEVVVVAGVRTPFVKPGTVDGTLDPVYLARYAVREVVERAELDLDHLDGLIVGSMTSAPEVPNLARAVSINAKLPARLRSDTVNTDAASGLAALSGAVNRIRSGDAGLMLVAAVDIGRQPDTGPGNSLESVAREFGIDRTVQDRFSLRSHERAAAAMKEGRLEDELTPLPLPPGFDKAAEFDNNVSEEMTADKLASVPPIFNKTYGTISAGNSGAVADGAVALVVASDYRARELGLPVLGRIRACSVVGSEPGLEGLEPAVATASVVSAAGRPAMEGIGLIEINETYAAQVLACVNAIGSRKFCEDTLGISLLGEIDPDVLNVAGGAIALGDPGGASGLRLVVALLREMASGGIGLGMAVTGGMAGHAAALIMERIR